jgi:SAM-dependent methyltransferase
MSSAEIDAFGRIYKDHEWGGTSKSGPGSDPELLHVYLDCVRSVLRRSAITSIVDVGCGDWAASRLIDWGTHTYTGIDVVPELVDDLNRRFGHDRITFVCRNFMTDGLPQADLCIIKDVLQHLSNAAVHRFLETMKTQFRFALITNDLSHEARVGWRWWKAHALPCNEDIANGGYRPLRLTTPPFTLQARQLDVIKFEFARELSGKPGTITEVKEILWWERA